VFLSKFPNVEEFQFRFWYWCDGPWDGSEKELERFVRGVMKPTVKLIELATGQSRLRKMTLNIVAMQCRACKKIAVIPAIKQALRMKGHIITNESEGKTFP
jgi:hypothetical protein